MPTMPTCTSNWNRRAAPPSRVKMAVPLPYGLALIEREALVVGRATRTTDEHRAEDLVVGSRPSRVRRGRAGVGLRKKPVRRRSVAPVDDDGRALAGRVGDVAGDLVAVLAGDERAHLAVGLVAGPDRRRSGMRSRSRRRGRRRPRPTASTTETAMQRSPAEPYAADDGGVGGHVEVGVGAARACGSSRRRAPAPACRCAVPVS